MALDLTQMVVLSITHLTLFFYNMQDALGLEGEKCGICMDIIIDRGLLDCCQHWYKSLKC